MSEIPLRSLPRAFVPGATSDAPIELPQDELDKLRKVLRLQSGAQIAVLPNNGSLIRCILDGRSAIPQDVAHPQTEPELKITLAQALPKGDKLDMIIRMCTEIGVSHFVLFPSERSVVRWDSEKSASKLRRLEAIAREACEVSFRTILPTFEWKENLSSVLNEHPNAVVLSEVEGLAKPFEIEGDRASLVIGPEGGWSPHELELIGQRGATLGPRVLRADTAGPVAAALALLRFKT